MYLEMKLCSYVHLLPLEKKKLMFNKYSILSLVPKQPPGEGLIPYTGRLGRWLDDQRKSHKGEQLCLFDTHDDDQLMMMINS